MDYATYYWLSQAREWRKRARRAELHEEKLLARCARLDRRISDEAAMRRSIMEIWGQQIDEALRVRRCIENATACLDRHERGMSANQTAQIIADAKAFLEVSHPNPFTKRKTQDA